MAVFVTQDEVQQWLETTKLGITEVDVELESSASTYIFARLGETYDTSGWIGSTTTPALVRKLISMLIAAWTYERTYSESSPDQPTWAQRLEAMVEAILTGLTDGSIALVDLPAGDIPTTTPEFWPTDDTGNTQQYDALGNPLGDVNSEDIKFTMGIRF
jgi:hypothetical protein